MAKGGVGHVLTRIGHALNRARERQRRRNLNRSLAGRLMTAVVCMTAGLMVIVSAMNARGTDLRPGRDTDLVSLVQSQSKRNAQLTKDVTELRRQVDELTSEQNQTSNAPLQNELAKRSGQAGLDAVKGPAVVVTLDDAPSSVAVDGIDEDLLVVHQQDIQAVVNVLWAAGAEAIAIQGQRVISTTGIKCVGNTVVLHGIPYAPPYEIAALGDQAKLQAGLDNAEVIQIYRQYVDAYGLGYRTEAHGELTFPAYQGTLELLYAKQSGAR